MGFMVYTGIRLTVQFQRQIPYLLQSIAYEEKDSASAPRLKQVSGGFRLRLSLPAWIE